MRKQEYHRHSSLLALTVFVSLLGQACRGTPPEELAFREQSAAAFHLIGSDSILDYFGDGTGLMSQFIKSPSPSQIHAMWIGNSLAYSGVRRAERGKEGSINEIVQADIAFGQDVDLKGEAFELRIRTTGQNTEEQSVCFQLSWEGREPVKGEIVMPWSGTLAFMTPAERGRYELILVFIDAREPTEELREF